MSGTYLVGTIAGSLVAMPAAAIEAVVRIDQVVPAPGAPSCVRGMVAIRSRILTLIDGNAVVGMSPCTGPLMAIVSVDGHGYGLMLESVEDVIELGALQPVGQGLSPGWAELDPMLCDHAGRVLLVVEPAAIIAAAAAVPLALTTSQRA